MSADSSTPSPTPRPEETEDPSMQPAAVPHEGHTAPVEGPIVEGSVVEGSVIEEPVSTSWPAVVAPWGTPGNHLTGPIPRIRRRRDGSLTHEGAGAEDDRGGEES
ncbi:hypothetical protein [Mobilicoccus pelagius]|uniref:Uncharacterized protein n=1 Tax=Mobilicoccus pelagius NBRC 104925 TaxID=1089455 RepID=H5UVT9_9MICO|nr:hypothetical protein [Mobilicoccus pelagius]GAB49847.1 hypothetical protein MOPEL_135_00850 [Mobilicoccus pelagius NBRC 104925]